MNVSFGRIVWKERKMKKILWFCPLLAFLFLAQTAWADSQKTLAEIWLTAGDQKESEPIKALFKSKNISRVNIQFFKIGIPGGILAIGRNTPAEGARAAIEIAKKYNRKKIDLLIPESLLPENYLAVGTSAYDESALIPVEASDVERLSNPSLSTEAFHALYLMLTHADQPYQKDYTRKFNNPR